MIERQWTFKNANDDLSGVYKIEISNYVFFKHNITKQN